MQTIRALVLVDSLVIRCHDCICEYFNRPWDDLHVKIDITFIQLSGWSLEEPFPCNEAPTCNGVELGGAFTGTWDVIIVMNGGNQFVKKKPKVKGKPVDKFDKYEPRPYAEWVKTREKVFTNIDKTFATWQPYGRIVALCFFGRGKTWFPRLRNDSAATKIERYDNMIAQCQGHCAQRGLPCDTVALEPEMFDYFDQFHPKKTDKSVSYLALQLGKQIEHWANVQTYKDIYPEQWALLLANHIAEARLAILHRSDIENVQSLKESCRDEWEQLWKKTMQEDVGKGKMYW